MSVSNTLAVPYDAVLDELEAEAIHIIREVAAEFERRPVVVGSGMEFRRLAARRYLAAGDKKAARHWVNDSPPVRINTALVAQALDQIEKAKGGYIDCHAWRMTPESFREIVETLYQLGKSPLRPLRVYDTARGQNEFFAVLGRDG